jgi:hypothetical protein
MRPFPVTIGIYTTEKLAEINKQIELTKYKEDPLYNSRLERWRSVRDTQHPDRDITIVEVDVNSIFDLHDLTGIQFDKEKEYYNTK